MEQLLDRHGRRAERITGYTVVHFEGAPVRRTGWRNAGAHTVRLVACDPDGVVIAEVEELNTKDAGAELVRVVYDIHRRIVAEAARHRCERCGRVKPASFHHKQHRSKGRSDAVSNGEWLCNECHQKEHGG